MLRGTFTWLSRQGVRVLDISALADFEGSNTSVGIGDGVGMREVEHYVFPDSDTWSFKTNWIAADGSFYGYSNDLTRGFDVHRFSGAGLSVPELEPENLGNDHSGRGSGTAAARLAMPTPALRSAAGV